MHIWLVDTLQHNYSSANEFSMTIGRMLSEPWAALLADDVQLINDTHPWVNGSTYAFYGNHA